MRYVICDRIASQIQTLALCFTISVSVDVIVTVDLPISMVLVAAVPPELVLY